MLSKITAGTPIKQLQRFEHLERLRDDRDHYLNAIKESLNCDRKTAKTFILAAQNGSAIGSFMKMHKLKGKVDQSVIDLLAELNLGRDIMLQTRPELVKSAGAANREPNTDQPK